MATVDLGKIRFNWKGAYNNGTAYVANDVVSSGGSSYMCILASTGNAVSNATYWSIMSSAGTDGTDVAATITTRGDILYRDGSGPARLAKGTATQVLTMGANDPAWAATAAGGMVLQVVTNHVNTRAQMALPAASVTNVSNLSCAITPTSASSKIHISMRWTGEISTASQDLHFGMRRGSTEIGSCPRVGSRGYGMGTIGESGGLSANYDSTLECSFIEYIDSPATTSATTYYMTANNVYAASTLYTNRVLSTSTATGFDDSTSSIILTELSAATTLLNGA